jgi:hypothetical protein
MILERPHIPARDQYPQEQFAELAKRDQQILDSFRGEYERRLEDEAAEVNAIVIDPATIVAHVVSWMTLSGRRRRRGRPPLGR